ncbi:MAG: UDP-2,4-diacetamido-2,4,6-trideoxy-beta-L-altropyranose hydrolase [Lachnospiraceae bacterium]|nr:UDP-2,4-diacetamido-2,4,6-trideoxy-beta-L-altropyranose hydrolase [Lachnospiraceae bacterium]
MMQVKGYFRNVKEADKELLFTWANDAETRRQSFSSAPITWDEHTAWFARTQADTDSPHWILMVCDEERGDAQPAGVLRLTRDQDGAAYRISYSIAPAWRGHGLGSLLLTLAKRWTAALCFTCTELYGEVKAENIASVRCFEKAGYEKAAGGTGSAAGGNPEILRFRADVPRKSLIYFRADANAQVGYGHLMRCLTIADACEGRGLNPVFVTADEESQGTIAARGFPCLTLNTDHRNMESELGKLPALLADGAPVVLDSYHVTKHYVETLKENGHRVAWMDDLKEQEYPVDMLINYNVYAKQLDYPMDRDTGSGVHPVGKRDGRCTYLLGPGYAPVRPSFRREDAGVRETLGTVLVTTGGSDPYGAGVWFAKLFAERLPDAKILVVCGPYAKGKDELYRLAEQNGNIEVVEGCSDLSSLMHESDLAVAAAGSTLYELCAAGLPGVLYYLADNQRMGAEAFARETGVVNLGDIRAESFPTEADAQLTAVLAHLTAAPERKKLADAMHALVDGNGAGRIAEALAKLVFTHET